LAASGVGQLPGHVPAVAVKKVAGLIARLPSNKLRSTLSAVPPFIAVLME